MCESVDLNLSVAKNLVGVFIGQGGIEFMDWDIPMWFLPCLFVCSFLFFCVQIILNKAVKLSLLIVIPLLGFLHILLQTHNAKIDMYRANYGNEFLFIINAILGSSFYILLINKIPKINILHKLGKITIPILALQLRSMSLIKISLVLVFGISVFDFSEVQTNSSYFNSNCNHNTNCILNQ